MRLNKCEICGNKAPKGQKVCSVECLKSKADQKRAFYEEVMKDFAE